MKYLCSQDVKKATALYDCHLSSSSLQWIYGVTYEWLQYPSQLPAEENAGLLLLLLLPITALLLELCRHYTVLGMFEFS